MRRFLIFLFLFFSVIGNVDALEKEEVLFDSCVDGDTAKFIIDCEVQTVRFLAIDTPETVHPTKGKEPYGKEASDFTCNSLKKAKKIAQKYREEISIKTPSLEQKVKNLSGGNQQKVILAKWLAAESELLIFDEPTRGIDVGAKQEIYTLINELVEQGKAVLMISSEMEELMGMSDRIIILAEGCISGEITKPEFNQETIMQMASKERKEQ